MEVMAGGRVVEGRKPLNQITVSTREVEAAGGGVTHYARILAPLFGHFHTVAVAMVAGTVYMRPYQVDVQKNVDRLAFHIWATAGNVRMGIYEDNGDTPVGGALVVESASVAAGGAQTIQEVVIPDTQLDAGLYWSALQCDNGGLTVQAWSPANLLDLNATLGHYNYARAGGYGAFTDPCPASVRDSEGIRNTYMRVASVP